MSESPASPSDDAPLISDDFLQGDVRAGLDRMRKRLLDLTARNRLLNFPQRPSKTSLRTVDELPDQLFGHLTNGKDLTFKAVPRPKGYRIPTDDQLGLEADESGESTRLAGPRYPPAKDHAERIGLATSFDLPPTSSDPLGDHHTDRAIQTLHYPEDLEVILRKVAGAARLAIEETGSNMLYLVFGFLEWYESDDSEQARFAPLMLLPVALEKGGVDDAGTIRYSLRQSGEDVATNVSLQERLRRDFGVEIPQLAEDDTPESYFAKLAFLPDLHQRWRVRRQVTLTLLSFGKILMYRDLDPDTWPKGSSPAEHARITEFFRGIQTDSITFAEEYSLDDIRLRQQVPMLVDEADSSQHSALVDAMAGKNLVIQGPPGTGKSQTITNLIASALAAGKTVLFVSDKLAALEVVRDRLDRVGMGTFCLELHSHKAQKRQILEDVEQRLQSYGSFRDPAQLDSRLGSIATDKELLTSYAELINRPFGALGRTLHDIVWGARRQRAGLPFPPDLVEGITIDRASAITPEVLADHHQESVQFATHLRNVLGACDSVRHHPWFGVRNAELTFADEATVTTLLGAWKTACSELIDAVGHANDFAGVVWLGDSLSSLKQIVEDARLLPETDGGIIPELLPKLWRKDVRACLTEFMRWVGEYRRTIDAITQLVGIVPNLSPAQVAELQPLVARGQDMLPKATVVGDFAARAADCHFAASEIQRARIVMEQITRTLRVDIPFTQEGVAVALAALAVIEATPLDALHLRSTGLDLPGAQESLAAAEGETALLRTRREALGKRLDLSLLPPTSELRSHITATANARWWSFLSGDYRAAKRAYVGMARDSQRASNIEMREGFRRVHEFTGAEQRFCTNQTYRALAGAHFNGIDSPFDKLRLLTLWRSDAESELARFTALGSSVGSAVWGASAEQLRSLHNATSPASTLASCFRSGGEAIAKAAGVMHAGVSATDGDWDTVGKALEQVGAELSSLAASFQSAGVPGSLPTDKVPELVRTLTELRSLAQLIGATAEARDALQTHYQGIDTDLGRIVRTIGFFDAIVSGPMPKSVKEWILHPDVEARLAHVRGSVALVRIKVPALEARWEAFAHLVDLDQSQWFGTDHLGELTLSGHVERVDRAVAHRDLLAAWLDYLRSRRPIVDRDLNEIAELAERRQIDVDAVSSAVAFVVLNSLVREAFASHQQLARFSGLSHEQVRLRFAKFDREAIALYRERAAKLADGRPVRRLVPRRIFVTTTCKQQR